MVVERFDEFKAFLPGCAVWFMAPTRLSRWSRKIDWYLNFQMTRAFCHQTRDLPVPIRDILDQEGLEVLEPTRLIGDQDPPLMIACESLLPIQMAVVVPFGDDLKAWSESCLKIWSKLNQPDVRVFLPDLVSFEDFAKTWPETASSTVKVQIVSGAS